MCCVCGGPFCRTFPFQCQILACLFFEARNCILFMKSQVKWMHSYIYDKSTFQILLLQRSWTVEDWDWRHSKQICSVAPVETIFSLLPTCVSVIVVVPWLNISLIVIVVIIVSIISIITFVIVIDQERIKEPLYPLLYWLCTISLLVILLYWWSIFSLKLCIEQTILAVEQELRRITNGRL